MGNANKSNPVGNFLFPSALSGYPQQPAFGSPPLAGYALWDDFTDIPSDTVTSATANGKYNLYNSGGTSGSLVRTSSSAATEFGLATLDVGDATSGHLSVIEYAQTVGHPPFGAIYMFKGRSISNSDVEVWSGLINTNIDPSTTTSAKFIGFRFHAIGAATNWSAVCKNGISTETVVSMGVAATSYNKMGFQIGSDSITFFVIESYGNKKLIRRNIANIITNIPDMSAGATIVPLGVKNNSSAQKTARIDFYSYCGRVER